MPETRPVMTNVSWSLVKDVPPPIPQTTVIGRFYPSIVGEVEKDDEKLTFTEDVEAKVVEPSNRVPRPKTNTEAVTKASTKRAPRKRAPRPPAVVVDSE